MSRRSGHQKWDAKKMTMKKLISYDSDLAPRFDDDEDGQEPDSRFYRPPPRSGSVGRGGKERLSVKVHPDNNRDRQIQHGTGGSATTSAVVMNQIRVVRGAAIGKDFIMWSIGQYVDDVKPLLFRIDRGDITFFVEDDDTAAAIHATSRRVRDPTTNSSITFLLLRVSAGFATISISEKQLIAECLKKRYNPEKHKL